MVPLTIYDPTLDPDRRAARRLVDLLTAQLGDLGPGAVTLSLSVR